MSTYILSPECGDDIGCLFKAFQLLQQKHNDKCFESQNGTLDPSCVELKPDVIKPIDYILNVLGLEKECCRMRMVCHVDFDNIYKSYN